MTHLAETFLSETDLLQCRDGRVLPRRDIEARLSRAISASVARSSPPLPPFVIDACDARGVTINFRIAGLPRDEHDLGIGAAAIVIIEVAADLAPNRQLSSLLTEAETEIAVALLKGARAAEIAADRGTTYETVRSQLKSIYSKLNVSSQIELISRMNSWQR
uniref:Transcriptional regulator, LuxR family n=1 Tax=Rhodopseudomonas palustris (strain BisA53) TaxID=316055 RepID=Q07SL1_RHOP5